MDKIACPECEGSRLRKESMYFKVNDKNIAQLAQMDIIELAGWFDDLENHLISSRRHVYLLANISSLASKASAGIYVGISTPLSVTILGVPATPAFKPEL